MRYAKHSGRSAGRCCSWLPGRAGRKQTVHSSTFTVRWCPAAGATGCRQKSRCSTRISAARCSNAGSGFASSARQKRRPPPALPLQNSGNDSKAVKTVRQAAAAALRQEKDTKIRRRKNVKPEPLEPMKPEGDRKEGNLSCCEPFSDSVCANG